MPQRGEKTIFLLHSVPDCSIFLCFIKIFNICNVFPLSRDRYDYEHKRIQRK